jgi:hypothetical protein
MSSETELKPCRMCGAGIIDVIAVGFPLDCGEIAVCKHCGHLENIKDWNDRTPMVFCDTCKTDPCPHPSIHMDADHGDTFCYLHSEFTQQGEEES